MARRRERARRGAGTPAPAPHPPGAQPSAPVSAGKYVTLARVVRARGRVGEVAAEILTDFPERLPSLRDVFLVDSAGLRRAVRVHRCWLSPSRGGQAIFHFAGVDSISEAEKLVGCEVQLPLADRAPLPQGRYYITDLIGCEVWEVKEVKEHSPEDLSLTSFTSPTSLTSLGFVRDVYLESGTPLLAVETPQGELLVPLADEICTRIDAVGRRIEVRLPPGLRELNK